MQLKLMIPVLLLSLGTASLGAAQERVPDGKPGSGNPAAPPKSGAAGGKGGGGGVPVLKDVPVLGTLFQTRNSQAALLRRRDELVRALAEAQARGNSKQEAAAQEELRKIDEEMIRLKVLQDDQLRLAALQKPVMVDLKDATLQQAAKVLSQASGLEIRVSEDVPTNLRYSVVARGIPLSSVLEGIARQGNIMISPGKGVNEIELSPWPMLEINGSREVYSGPLAPWSIEWGTVPSAQSISLGMTQSSSFPLSMIYGTDGEMLRGVFKFDPRIQGEDLTLSGGKLVPFGGQRFRGLELGVGDRSVVIAEPGTSPSGEPGYWLTLYRIDGEELKKQSTLFHRSAPAAPSGMGPKGKSK